MNPLGDFRGQIQALYLQTGKNDARLPFFRRSKDDQFLLVTDAPRQADTWPAFYQALQDAGYPLGVKNRLAYIDALPGFYNVTPVPLPPCPNESLAPAWWLCRIAAGTSPSLDITPVRKLLKAMEEGEQQVLMFCQAYPAALALALRIGQATPRALTGFLSSWCASQF